MEALGSCVRRERTVQSPRKEISEAEAKEKFEWLNLKEILQHSSNVGAAKVALKLGADSYFNTLKTFGFTSKTGSGFPGEISGRMPARKRLATSLAREYWIRPGYFVTPIQMARAYATFLNGGYLVQPKLIRNADSVPGTQEEAPKRIISVKVAQEITEALRR